jgi:chromosome segregation ATPase
MLKLNDNEIQLNVIDNIYTSLSKIIHVLTQDNANINQQILCLSNRIDQLNTSMNELQEENKSIVHYCKTEIDTASINMQLYPSKNNFQQQILDMRTMLIQLINNSNSNINKEIEEVKKIKTELQNNIKLVISSELKEYIDTLPNFDKKLEEFAKEYRANLANHVRKISKSSVPADTIIDRLNKLENLVENIVMYLNDEQQLRT